MYTPWLTRKTKILTVSLVTLVLTMLYASAAWASTFTVTNLSDSGAGSLRDAIEKANANAGADEIVFADEVGVTIILSSTLPTDAEPAELSIDGGGDVTLSGNDAVRVERGAEIIRILPRSAEGCGTGTSVLGGCQIVLTPSGTVNLWAQAHPQQVGPAAGGGASHELDITECAFSTRPAKGVITPSGNVNVHCAGKIIG